MKFGVSPVIRDRWERTAAWRFCTTARVATAGADGAIRCRHIDHRGAMGALRRRLLRELTISELSQ
ncbi:hypothetical protein [Roseiflexus sp.]|uniref:hypothetical protein n=1 Tax=Roseiflexus sp. TaxID=2562120 RepID=UPI00398A68C7